MRTWDINTDAITVMAIDLMRVARFFPFSMFSRTCAAELLVCNTASLDAARGRGRGTISIRAGTWTPLGVGVSLTCKFVVHAI